jgi:tetratricopeptide (TPR) repeat protein
MLSRARRLLVRPLAELDGILKLDRRNIDALLLKGNLLEIYFSSFREMHDEARKCQEAALGFAPNNASTLTDIGDWYAVDGQYRRALKFYDAALRQLRKGTIDRSSKTKLEAVYIGKVGALRDWNRMSAARRVAREGLQYCPTSTILRAWSRRSAIRKSSGG